MYHLKTRKQADQIRQAISRSILCQSLKPGQINQLVRAFDGPFDVKAGETVIEEDLDVPNDEPGLFIIESGTFAIFKREEDRPICSMEIGSYDQDGHFFSELALLHNYPRNASVVASSDGVL